eukprot:TRINITY_DN4546_c0_g1_i1.p1 TRINITY_DN4546_c0_g1~~TRINITY_DN4546_c0_g1_i1.p1  ORF type:complete len:134 (+),score=10.02 TRINITY_DN4546_c0_g1_i1:616-1017(+)
MLQQLVTLQPGRPKTRQPLCLQGTLASRAFSLYASQRTATAGDKLLQRRADLGKQHPASLHGVQQVFLPFGNVDPQQRRRCQRRASSSPSLPVHMDQRTVWPFQYGVKHTAGQIQSPCKHFPEGSSTAQIVPY